MALAAVLPLIVLPTAYILSGGGGLWNDFATYWLAGKLVAAGQSPYDLEALAQLGAQEDIHFVVGTGFSYPLPWAVAMVPLAAIPFALAAILFAALSIVVFGLAVAAWLHDPVVAHPASSATIFAAFAAGLYPPVVGSVLFGQANLLVLGALGLAVRRLVRRDGRGSDFGGVWAGMAGIVKVTPLAIVVPLAMAKRMAAAGWTVAGAGTALVLASLVAPAGMGGVDRLVRLGEPDPYWSNQSINGYVSRIVLGNDRVEPLVPTADAGLIGALSLASLAVVTLLILVRTLRQRPSIAVLALGIGLTLVAATAGAPKNSFWNHVPALIGAALLLAPLAGGRGVDTSERVLLGAWYALAVFGFWFDSLHGEHPFGSVGSVLSGAPLIGLFALFAAIATRLQRVTAAGRALAV